MGSSSKKYKEKETRKRRHRSESEDVETPREKKHRHRRHHKDRKREKQTKPYEYEYESGDSDVVEVIPDETPQKPPQMPEHSGGSADSLSVDETNKLRAKLGLKPLSQSATTSDGKRKDDLGEFYHKPAENLATRSRNEKIKKKLSEHKEKRSLEGKLSKVKLLGESDSEDDVGAWVDKSRSLLSAKKEAEKRAKMLEELDEQFGVGEVVEQRAKRLQKKYTEKHLRGLKVDHDVDTFDEGKTVVLTLKDQGVLDEDDDVLVNVNMLDDERYKKNVENLKKKLLYNAYDTEEVDEFGNVKRKSLLYKYDEEIEGEKRESFKIGEENIQERKQLVAETIRQKLERRRLETIGETSLALASDYYNEEELAKFKKPKKKVRKIRSKGKILTADELENQANNAGIEEIGTRRPKIRHEDFTIDDIPAVEIPTNLHFEDKDDELERALHKARKAKQKDTVLADLLLTNSVETSKPEPTEENVDGGNIVLNSTAEFCRTLGDIPTYGKSGNREEISDDMLDFERETCEDADVEEPEEEERGGRWSSVDPNYKPEAPVVVDPEVPILDEEPDVSSGVGAALKLAMSKGYLEKEENKRPSNSRLAHLQAKHYSIEDKSYGDEGDRVNRRERYSGPIQDFKEKDGFKPNVKLEYIDDDGHVLNSKEAFRYLSHKFHGKGPGKNKIEKRIKKNVQEGLMKKMSSTDTPLGTLNMLQAKQKEMQSPYIVLSGSKHTHSTVISKASRR